MREYEKLRKRIEDLIVKYEVFSEHPQQGRVWIGPLESGGYYRAINDVILDLKKALREK